MTPSPWVVRWAGLLPRGAEVLDLACGGGRHAVYLAGLGHEVTAVDRDLSLAAPVRDTPGVCWLQADLEADAWPFAERRFRAVVVTNYLHRPLFAPLLDALAPDGVLIYETFAIGQAKYGRPRNPAHLLMPGELLEWMRGRARVLAYEDVEEPQARRCVQRLCALRL
ncbi:MAG: class I SAM-dependent methyltransferase [Pseudomonadota bacterium]